MITPHTNDVFTRDVDTFHCGPPKRIGKTYWLCGRKQSLFPFTCLIGPDWPCMLLTYFLIIGIPFVFLYFAAFKVHWSVGVAGIVLDASLILCYSMTACSDPGIVYAEDPRWQAEEKANNDDEQESCKSVKSQNKDNYIECGMCKIHRPKGASHCYDCNVCVHELDHHCPWTGKCIGQKNLNFFYSFVTLLCVNIVYIIVCAIVYAQQQRM
mmetsp:Transcript_30764/g.38553  ORF Transcript_30764/g.38553 Transcript_30764/m.38553 type:complete len:211 (-) Transcript_30764:69-701(-)